MINSKVLGKPYKTKLGYLTQIEILQKKLTDKVNQIEIQINEEKNPEIRISLQAQRSDLLKRVQQAKDEPFTIEETESNPDQPGEES